MTLASACSCARYARTFPRFEFPEDPATFAVENQYMVGSGLLVVPVLAQGVTSVEAYFAGSQPWYDVLTGLKQEGGGLKTVSAPLRKVPVFQRGGTVLPRKMRARRTSSLMVADPFTFDVALDREYFATGSLFIDDYHTFAYRNEDKFLRASMTFAKTGNGRYTFR